MPSLNDANNGKPIFLVPCAKAHRPNRLLALFLVAIGSSPSHAQRALPDNNLGYPVLITLTDGTGSGFYLNANKAVFLVTAKHVLFGKDQKPRLDTIHLRSYQADPANPEAVHIVRNPVRLRTQCTDRGTQCAFC